MRRLSAHPAVRDALAAGTVSVSWARAICDWSDLLPESARGDADLILLAAAAAGAALADLAGLAEELRARTARPDADGDDGGFGDRAVRLDLHYRGAGKLGGDLTPRCAAAVQAVLDALGKKAGPEDTRTAAQRYHDALEDAMRRLIAAGGLPDRAGQPTQIQLIMTLDQLTGLASPGGTSPAGTSPGGTSPAGPGSAAGPGGGSAAGGDGTGNGWAGPGPLAGPGDDCDASIVPIVLGHVDHDLLDRLPAVLARPQVPCPGGSCRTSQAGTGQAGTGGGGSGHAVPGPVYYDRGDHAERMRLLGENARRELILRQAVALLSGPSGLAARLRAGTLTGPAASVSLPLDIGTATDTIPAHLRRAVIARDKHCAWPGGCSQRPAGCQVHHLVPRSKGGRTSLTNCGLFCAFHHLIVIHQWGWTVVLNADGTMTATSPDRTRTLRSHSPPATAA